MNLPLNIAELAEKNGELVMKMNFEPGIDDPFLLCNPDAYRKTGIFTETQIDELFDFERSQDQCADPNFPNNVGMILVRPDMFHIRGRLEEFIDNRFKITYSDDAILNSSAYWEIYRNDLYRSATMHSRLTRAAMYIGSTCRLIVFEGDGQGQPLADHMVSALKGSQGTPKLDTIRGDIVYNEAVSLGLHKSKISNDRERMLQLATDPFMAYRQLCSNTNGDHNNLPHPLLFFTGVGVHVPNYAEIKTDLHALAPDLADELSTA